METEVLEYFLKIAEYENITRASRELHVAQPHLTRQLHSLEENLGVQLFVREKRRLHITEEGRYVRQQTQQILNLLHKMQDQVRAIHDGQGGKLYIGTIETIGTTYLPAWIASFRQQYPRVKYSLWTANSQDVIDRLHHRLIDVAFVREPFDREQYHSLQVLDEEWMALMNVDHPLAKANPGTLQMSQLAEADLIVPTQRSRQISNWFGEQGLVVNIICEYAPFVNAITMAERGLGVAILPESAMYVVSNHPVTARRIIPAHRSTACLVWRRDMDIPGAAARFIAYIQQWAAENQLLSP